MSSEQVEDGELEPRTQREPEPGSRAGTDADGEAGAGGVGPSGWRDLVRFVPDLVRLLLAVAKDPRVPVRAKILAGGVGAYLISPVDVIPDFIPGIGQMDDLALVVWALRRLLQSAGYDVLRDLWTGSDDGFVALLVVAGIEE